MLAESFKIAFDALVKSSDRSRITIYLSIVVNFSIFVWVCDAIIFPLPDERLREIQTTISCLQNNWVDADYQNQCERLKTVFEKEAVLWEGINNHSADKPTLADSIRLDLLSEEAKARVEWRLSVKKYHFPIFGIDVDIDIMWLTTSFVGIFSLLAVRSTLERERRNFLYAFQQTEELNTLRVLLSTQMLVPRATGRELASSVSIRPIQRVVLYAILFLPILSQYGVLYELIDDVASGGGESTPFLANDLLGFFVSTVGLTAMVLLCGSAISVVTLQEKGYEDLQKQDLQSLEAAAAEIWKGSG